MDELVKAIFTAPLATVFIVAGVIFLLIGVVGKVSGKIEPSDKARIVSGVLGLAFIGGGLAMNLTSKPAQTSVGSPIGAEQIKPKQDTAVPQISAPTMLKPLDAPPTARGLPRYGRLEGRVTNESGHPVRRPAIRAQIAHVLRGCVLRNDCCLYYASTGDLQHRPGRLG